ncbi:MAG: succinate dehydrogenase, hydrophobic membrane anchor protein [Alphaproteobacteria bacterium]|jgi:succinate dehydrogenase / fumarate reductase membrane anchor subunit|nr:succinate dehydrogenase, hydrophobic membrane anchor protein [Alphaproteobacteria bacterium]
MSETFRTPLGRVRGAGSAKSGTGHFIAERASSVLLAFLTPWFVISAAMHLPFGYEGARAWVADPWVAAPLAVFVLVSLHHMWLGLTVIIEDYIGRPATKMALLLLNLSICIALAAASLFAILRISIGA